MLSRSLRQRTGKTALPAGLPTRRMPAHLAFAAGWAAASAQNLVSNYSIIWRKRQPPRQGESRIFKKTYFIIYIQYYTTYFPEMRLFSCTISANKTRYPIDRTAKPVSPARGAGNQPVRRRMLSRSLRERAGTCAATQLIVRRMLAHILPARSCGEHTRMAERQNLLEPYTPPKINFSGRKGSRMFRPPHKRAQYAVRGTIGEDVPAQSCKRCKAIAPQKAGAFCGAIFRIFKPAP